MKSKAGPKVNIVEVGLRDGLQNEKIFLRPEQRIGLAIDLIEAGIRRIELGSFVRPDKVPQMADSAKIIDEVLKRYPKLIQASALVPNETGLREATSTNLKEVAIFAACSETFSKKNINCSIEESFARFEKVMLLAKKNRIRVRGYLSTCFGCPYEGRVAPAQVLRLALKLIKLGCFEVSIGDTIGVATPKEVQKLFKILKTKIPAHKLAGHFHDTRGTALANILACYDLGIRVFDSSIAGLGGCPYAPGATGNVATEDVVYFFHQSGIETNIDLPSLIRINHRLREIMGKEMTSHLGKAGLGPTFA